MVKFSNFNEHDENKKNVKDVFYMWAKLTVFPYVIRKSYCNTTLFCLSVVCRWRMYCG